MKYLLTITHIIKPNLNYLLFCHFAREMKGSININYPNNRYH